MDQDEVVALLRKRCDEAGSIAAFARRTHCHRSHVHAVVIGKEKPAPAILIALGLRRITSYEPR